MLEVGITRDIRSHLTFVHSSMVPHSPHRDVRLGGNLSSKNYCLASRRCFSLSWAGLGSRKIICFFTLATISITSAFSIVAFSRWRIGFSQFISAIALITEEAPYCCAGWGGGWGWGWGWIRGKTYGREGGWKMTTFSIDTGGFISFFLFFICTFGLPPGAEMSNPGLGDSGAGGGGENWLL